MQFTEEAPAQDVLKRRHETRRLRFTFLAPLFLAIAVIVATLVFVNYSTHRRELERDVVNLRASATGLYEESVQQNIRALKTLMDVLEHDDALRDALRRRDRGSLLARTASLFEDMKRNYGITHLYFHGTDRVNLLRVHQPARHGDVIDRVTMLTAERGGAVTSGVELGPLGLFTLRLVAPWYDPQTRQLLGYVELGMEINSILENVHKLFGVDVYVLIRKEFIRRDLWEEGMRVVGRTPEWSRFPDVVLSVQTRHDLPPELDSRLRAADFPYVATSIEMDRGGASCQAILLPLTDVGGRRVAEVVLLADTSRQVAAAQRAVMAATVASVVCGAALFVFFFWLVGRVGRRIEADEEQLHTLAVRDPLTGLYNNRMFHALLNDEIARARRYKHSVALLMLDLDHFKRVNDTYGHLAGDSVLRGVARVLFRTVRQQDRVCRYGGEEISVILLEMGVKDAEMMAERARSEIERAVFKDDRDRDLRVTVSIGVAVLPGHAEDLKGLVAAADAALYAAKNAGRNRVCCSDAAASVATAAKPGAPSK